MFRLLTYIKNFFNREDDQLSLGSAYAVTTGTFVGEIFVYIKQDTKHIHFLSIPKMLNREVPLDKFEYATKNKVIEFVEKLPKNERIMCEKQYEANEQT